MDDAILRQKFQSEKDDSEYKAWLQEKEFTARFNAEQAMPGDEVEFLTRYTNEQLEELRDGIKARVKDVEKSLKDFKSSVELQLKSGLDDKLTSTDLAAVLVKERKRNDKELSSLTASLNGLLSTLDARITAASKQKPVVQQIVAPEKKRTPKAWFLPKFMPESNSYTTEDNPFYERAREAGFKVYLDQDASKLVSHIGRKAWHWSEVKHG
jgi:hypothetical protein